MIKLIITKDSGQVEQMLHNLNLDDIVFSETSYEVQTSENIILWR